MAAVQAPLIRPPLTGWLLKRKNENAKSRLLKGSNRRFFTLDFQAQIFYYSHNEGRKTISLPTHFRHIQSVESLSAIKDSEEDETEQDAPPIEHSASKGSVSSKGSRLRIPRMPSFPSLSKRNVEQHGFLLRMHGNKLLELLCDSKTEADTWIDAVRQAITLGKTDTLGGDETVVEEASKAELSTAPGTSCSTTPRSSHSSRPTTPPMLSEEHSARPAPPTTAFGVVDARDSTMSASAGEISQTETAPFSSSPTTAMAPLMKASLFLPQSSARSTTSADKSLGKVAMVPLLPPRSARSTGSGGRHSPQQGYVTSVVGVGVASQDEALGCWGGAAEEQKLDTSAAVRYSDKGEGLSINQRLSQMEFSDDEESDEKNDPSFPAQVNAHKKSEQPTALASVADTVTVEACEAFVAPDSDTE